MPGLTDILFNGNCQKQFIERGAHALYEIRSHGTPGKLFGMDPPPAESKKKNVSINASTLLQSLGERQKTSNVADGEKIAGYFQNVAAVEQSRVVLTFAALSMFVLFPLSVIETMAETEPFLAPFFFGNSTINDISTRFEIYITGAENVPAKLPTEIVVAELILFHRLCR